MHLSFYFIVLMDIVLHVGRVDKTLFMKKKQSWIQIPTVSMYFILERGILSAFASVGTAK